MNPKRKQIQCEVNTPEGFTGDAFANAFRVLPDGAEFLLDFLVYSHHEESARLVARLRVNPGLLAALRDQLGGSLRKIEPTPQHVFMARGSEEVH